MENPYLIFVASISSGASVNFFDWEEIFPNERKKDSREVYCVMLYSVCDFTHSVKF